MNQELPKGPEKAKEKNWEDMTPEEQAAFEAEMMEDVKKRHPEMLAGEVPPEKRRECGPEVARLEEMMTAFEATHSLGTLHQIINLKPALDPRNPQPGDAELHPVRQPALLALKPIVALLNTIEEETNITSERRAVLIATYQRLSQAVGMINKNKVDHTRTVS